MAIIKAIGDPENDSERKAITYFGRHLPDNYVLFHNLELPNRSGLPYEFDIIVVGEYAVFHVEVKGYQGLIRGNAEEWKLQSGAVRKSPIPLANKKAKILATRIQNPRVWVQSIIALTDDRGRVRLDDPQVERVLRLQAAVRYMTDPKRLLIANPRRLPSMTMNQVSEAIFRQFRPLHRQHEIGHYDVIETVTKNELYTLFLAQHDLIRTQGRFGLKVYTFDIYANPETQKKQRERIVRDANALLHLGYHPHIVRAFPPFPWQDNKIVLPLEWVDGYSLRGLLDHRPLMPFQRKIEIISKVALALQHAHSLGVIHRDVRPDNIIIADDGGVKLINFDYARVEAQDMQTIATRIGKQLDERYAAPEIWRKAWAASPQSDLYALGALFFEWLTGQPPCRNMLELFENQGLPHKASHLNPHLPPDVDYLISRMCAFYPKERYQSMKELLEDLAILG